MPKTTISPRNAAIALGIDLNYLYKLLATGRLAGVKTDGLWAVDAAAVEQRLAKRAARNQVEKIAELIAEGAQR